MMNGETQAVGPNVVNDAGGRLAQLSGMYVEIAQMSGVVPCHDATWTESVFVAAIHSLTEALPYAQLTEKPVAASTPKPSYIDRIKKHGNVTFVTLQYLKYLVTERPAWFPEGKKVTTYFEYPHQDGPHSLQYEEFMLKMIGGDGFSRHDYLTMFENILFTDETPEALASEGPYAYRFATFEQIESIFKNWW